MVVILGPRSAATVQTHLGSSNRTKLSSFQIFTDSNWRWATATAFVCSRPSPPPPRASLWRAGVGVEASVAVRPGVLPPWTSV